MGRRWVEVEGAGEGVPADSPSNNGALVCRLMPSSRTGVVLLQLGTPDSPSVGDVRRYLREFLGDPRVLTMPAVGRWLLLNLIILPFRPRRAAHAYRQIWTEEGSPLLVHSEELADGLRRELGGSVPVEVGMRYGSPSIRSAVDAVLARGADRIIAIPQFPQYASASGGSAVAALLDELGSRTVVPEVVTLGSFPSSAGFIDAAGVAAGPSLDAFGADHVLFSFHGLPESHLKDVDTGGERCLVTDSCCSVLTDENRHCYRAQTFATTAALALRLGLNAGEFSTAFQSRLAGSRWITPHTDRVLPRLYEAGVRRLAVATPSFTADCLETLEEIGIRGRNQWMALGGEDFLLLPCVNASPRWVTVLADQVRSLMPENDDTSAAPSGGPV